MDLSEQNITDMLEGIPTFSQSVIRILELTTDLDSPTTSYLPDGQPAIRF